MNLELMDLFRNQYVWFLTNNLWPFIEKCMKISQAWLLQVVYKI